MIRVVYVANTTALQSGSTRSLLALLRGVRQMGVEPVVLTPDRQGLYEAVREMGIQVISLPYKMSIYPSVSSLRSVLLSPFVFLSRWVHNTWAEYRLKRWLKQNPVDIIHTNTSVNNIGRNVAHDMRIPHIYHFREYGDRDFSMRYAPSFASFHRRFKTYGNYAIAITRDIMHHHQLDDYPRARQIYNGIVGQGMPATSDAADQYFLFVGRLEYAKGVDELLEAYAEYVRRAEHVLPLWLAGAELNVEFCQKLHRLVSDAGLEQHVKFLGPRDDISQLMSAARAIIISSRNEAFGRCMPEAMSCHCLVIGKDVGGTHEQLDNGFRLTGQEIGLRYNDKRGLVEHLLAVSLASVGKYDSMRDAAYCTAVSLYSEQSYVESIVKLYEEIVR